MDDVQTLEGETIAADFVGMLSKSIDEHPKRDEFIEKLEELGAEFMLTDPKST